MDRDSAHSPASMVPRDPVDRIDVSKRTIDAVMVVSLAGELDARTAPVAHKSLSDVLPVRTPVLLDLTDMGYVSSAGLRTMLMVYREAQRIGTPIALAGVSATLRSVLSATGFLRFFRVADSVPEGIAVLQLEHDLANPPTDSLQGGLR
jgi:anti-sigma B factor antagonist